jgi:hypothetical protein
MSEQQTRINYKLTVFLSQCCVFILILLFAQWQYSKYSRRQLFEELDNIEAIALQNSNMPELDLIQKSLDSYDEMITRPLFIEGRKPVEEAEIAEPSVFSDKMDLILTGIIAKPEGMIAILQDKQKLNHQLQLDDAYAGWQVESIDADKVVLARNNERSQLLLRKPPQEAGKTLKLPKGLPKNLLPGKKNTSDKKPKKRRSNKR